MYSRWHQATRVLYESIPNSISICNSHVLVSQMTVKKPLNITTFSYTLPGITATNLSHQASSVAMTTPSAPV